MHYRASTNRRGPVLDGTRHRRPRHARPGRAHRAGPVARRCRGARGRQPEHAVRRRARRPGPDGAGPRPHRDRPRHEHRAAPRRGARRAGDRPAPCRPGRRPGPAGWERRILSPVLPGVEFEFMRTTIGPGVDAGEFAPHARGLPGVPGDGAGHPPARRSTARRTCCAPATVSYYAGDCRPRVRQSRPRSRCVYYLAMDADGEQSARPARPGAAGRPEETLATHMTQPALCRRAAASPRGVPPPGSRRRRHDRRPPRGLRDRPVFMPMSPAERAALLGSAPAAAARRPRALLDAGRARGPGAPHGQRPPALLRLGELAAGADRRRSPSSWPPPSIPSCAGGDHAAIYLERAPCAG